MQEIRKQIKPYIKEKCGTMRVLDMPKPIELTGKQGIYTNVNILEEITGRRRLKVAELMQSCDHDNFERLGLSRVKQKRVSGLEVVQRYSKLMVLGKPGAGKTTFLKYLAMQCIEGRFQADKVPLFITLKDFAEAPKKLDILKFIVQKLSSCGVTHTNVTVETLLKQGKVLVLLDGLDEVQEEDTKRVLQQIREFSDLFHTNQFIITCRIAAKEYTFESFTEVEMADFDEKQIAIFVQHWFKLTDPVKGKRFIQKLKENKPIQELASSPLLLTLLCLVFGDSGDFPANRSELYQEGLDVLLKKWDAKRNIERDHVYKNLSLQRKEDLLSQIALTTFEQKDYFFKQKTAEAYIVDFIRNLRDADTDPEVLKLDSEAVLKSIEAQHGLLVERAKGIYSFSHLTFQEYFAAREIIANSAYENLVEHITEKRWREIFLLTVSMIRNSDRLLQLIKQETDRLLVNEKNLQSFLIWLDQKSLSIKAPYKPAAIRAFYLRNEFDFRTVYDDFLDVDQGIDLNFEFIEYAEYDFSKLSNYEICFPLDHSLSSLLDKSQMLSSLLKVTNQNNSSFNEHYSYFLNHQLDECFNFIRDPNLYNEMSKLQEQLPALNYGTQSCLDWWQAHGQNWTEKLGKLLKEARNIRHDWQLSDRQINLLCQYCDGNNLLIDCLNSDCYVSQKVRQNIEETLLLPVANL
ncbi:NACHT domain-containing NTPase [Tolypothrix sp. PCC 7910]|uniref:NACHT domain-containing protein n=1 Tax=Tolypothrix sp. PCC 7910 TaxID=2099387 RepID=UPI001FCB44E3|nr:NACHT domain-containing NTPase [Tolypothrix sp. PCC 7910]